MDYKDPKVLEWVNEIRAEEGRRALTELRRAKKDEHGEVAYPRSCNCPIARSLGKDWRVNNRYATKPKAYITLDVPSHVGDWISQFDEGYGVFA